ncbi:hypothetical protein Mapa_009081 [Marchantia paleacea]|nr:hypothetical protein Mapa_009081 [Marchantia paleacea]
MIGINLIRRCSSSILDSLVEPHEPGCFTSVIRESSHDPVAVGLAERIAKAIQSKECNGTSKFTAIFKVHLVCVGFGRRSTECELKSQTPSPCDTGNDQKEGKAQKTSNPPARAHKFGGVQKVPHEVGAQNLCRPVQSAIESPGSSCEKPTSIDGIELVGVEPVGCQEHRRQGNHAPVQEKFGYCHSFGRPRRVLVHRHWLSIAPDDHFGWQQR